MREWLIVLICVLGYMFLVTINNIIKDCRINDEVSFGDILLGGVFTWILICINCCVKLLFYKIRDIKYKALIQDEQGNIYYCSSKQVDDIVRNSNMSRVLDWEQYRTDFKYWNKKLCHKNIPNTKYTPKQVWKRYKKYRGE